MFEYLKQLWKRVLGDSFTTDTPARAWVFSVDHERTTFVKITKVNPDLTYDVEYIDRKRCMELRKWDATFWFPAEVKREDMCHIANDELKEYHMILDKYENENCKREN